MKQKISTEHYLFRLFLLSLCSEEEINAKKMKKLFIAALLFVASVMGVSAQEGAWSGELDAQGTKFPLVFNFNADGTTINPPSQGVNGLKAEKSFTPEGKICIAIPQIKCPVLALNGKKDTQVNYQPNLEALDKGLTAKHQTVALDNLNHLFQHCTTGSLIEYQQIEETFSPEALDKVLEWMKGF